MNKLIDYYIMKIIVFTFLTFQISTLFGQNTMKWLHKNVIPISTTDQYVNNSKE